MTTSGTTSFNPTVAQVVVECAERCDMRASELTTDHLISMKMSMNLTAQTFANRGVNLWVIDQQVVSLSQGVATYSVPSSTIDILPDSVIIRQWIMGGFVSVPVNFATTISTPTITVTQANHGYVAGGFVNIQIPVAIGGLILVGFYQIVSVPNVNSYIFSASSNATSSATGGAVPSFTTTAASAIVTTTLAAHGYSPGQSFVVQVATNVGGISLTGTYTIVTVPTADTFTFTAANVAGANATVSENSGNASIAGSSSNTQTAYTDRIVAMISRGDYIAQPNKNQQGFPTTAWYDRLISPSITLWQTPDGNGPYQLIYDRTSQIQDVSPAGTQTIQIPQRFYEAYIAGVAALYSMKWATAKAKDLVSYAALAWTEAESADRERVITSIIPRMGGYYR